MTLQQLTRQVLIAAAAGVVASLVVDWLRSRRAGCSCEGAR